MRLYLKRVLGPDHGPGLFRLPAWTWIVMFVLVLGTGLGLRLHTLLVWQTLPEHTFFEDQPLFMENDGYYYMRLARDWNQGIYGSEDTKRGAPDNIRARPPIPPLLSILAGLGVRLTGGSYNWTGAFLAPILGCLAGLPVFFLGRRFGGPVTGLVAALVTLLAPFYAYRTNFAFCDTDGLVVTLSLTAALAALSFGVEKTARRYAWFGVWLAAYLLLSWAWGTTISNATLFCIPPFLASLVFMYRPPRKEAIGFFVAGLGIFFLAWAAAGPQIKVGLKKMLVSYPRTLFTKNVPEFWPSSRDYVAEIDGSAFSEITRYACGHPALLCLALAGLVLLALHRKKEITVLVSLGLVGCSAFFIGPRYVIFLSPVLGLGLGFLVTRLFRGLDLDWIRGSSILLCMLVLSGFLLLRGQIPHALFQPTTHPTVVAGMAAARQKTPADAVLWSDWGIGYSLTYWTDRATIGDGGIMGGNIAVASYLPLATKDFRLSANFIQFYSARGQEGLKKLFRALDNDREKAFHLLKPILSGGPGNAVNLIKDAGLTPDWLSFFFPEKSPPTYLFLHFNLARTLGTWFSVGEWQGSQIPPVPSLYIPFQAIQQAGSRLVSHEGLDLDLKSGIGRTPKGQIRISELLVLKGRGEPTRYRYGSTGPRLEILAPAQFGALMTPRVANSVFNRLHLRQEAPPAYFKPVALHSPYFQLWKVTGDKVSK